MRLKDIDKLIEEAADQVEAICSPDKMGQNEALFFIEGVIARLECSRDALLDEIEGEE